MGAQGESKSKHGELIKCIIYGIIINILGNLSYWYTTAIKDILKNDFGVNYEFEVTEIVFDFYNWFVVG